MHLKHKPVHHHPRNRSTRRLAIMLALVLIIIALSIAYNNSGNRQKREIDRKLAKLTRMVGDTWSWYQTAYGEIQKHMDQSQRGKLTAKLNCELRARLDKIGSFKAEIERSYKQMQTMPNTYKSIDDTIQKMKKEAEGAN
jgi:hypothetical protein